MHAAALHPSRRLAGDQDYALHAVQMLLEIITRREVQAAQRNLFDCAKDRPFNTSIAQGRSMFEAITLFLIVLSVGILIAHALDAFRHRT
jgi:hypothetical protein